MFRQLRILYHITPEQIITLKRLVFSNEKYIRVKEKVIKQQLSNFTDNFSTHYQARFNNTLWQL